MRKLPVVDQPPARAPSRVALISITTFCNAHCEFCCVLDVLNRPELNPTDERIFAEIEGRRREGSTILSFTGGEPTVHPRFADFCQRGRELGYESITINTNGIQFKDARFTAAALDAGLSNIDFSVHGPGPELHDRLMARKGAFDAFARGIEHIHALRGDRRIVLGSTTVVTTENAPQLVAIVDRLIDLGIETLRLKHCFSAARTTELGLVPQYQAYVSHVRDAIRHARARGRMISVTHFPLCLLGEEAAFASDFQDESVLAVDWSGEVIADGRATLHRRTSAAPCERCALADTCTRLDDSYEAELGEATLRPFASRLDAARFVREAVTRYPSDPLESWLRTYVRKPSARAPSAGGAQPLPEESRMSIGFISPTFRVLEINWDHDYEMVKLGVPTVMGHLYRNGHTDCEHWDFDAQICAAVAIDPGAFDLKQYFDEALVSGFLAGTDDTLQAHTERLLDVLGVTEKAVFGISLSAVLDRIANVMALGRLAQCLAKVLHERYPRSKIVIGGLQASPDSQQPAIYQTLLEQCSAFDYAWFGDGTYRAVQFFRDLLAGASPEHVARLGPQVIYRDANGTVVRGVGEAHDDTVLDPDLRTGGGLKTGLAVHTKTGALPETSCAVDEQKLVSAIDLVRRGARHVAAAEGSRATDFDAVDLDAAEAGAHAYDEIPAAVPVFDPKLVDQFRYSGLQIMKRFHFDKELMLRFSKYENDRIVVLPHIFVRGCNAPCGFCAYAYTKIEGEDLEQTIAGLRFLSETYDCNNFHFLNTQINSVYRYAEMFCDRVIESGLDIRWSDCCNMRALDERLLEKMRRAGAVRLVFGVESPEDEMLRMIHKGIKVEQIARLLEASHQLGIWNHVLLIAGMPHETKAKQDRMMEFLARTSHAIDFYSVSSFYLVSDSPWGRDPAKFGIDRISDPANLLESQAFHEDAQGKYTSDGLRWPEKKQQIVDSTQRFYRTITQLKGQSRCVGGNIDLYLLMFLYRSLGHDRKAEIVDIYTQTGEEIARRRGEAQTMPATRVRVHLPFVTRRVNEADQSALVTVPIDLDVSAVSDGGAGFSTGERWRLGWSVPGQAALVTRMTDAEKALFEEHLRSQGKRFADLVGPFARALEQRLRPGTAERMAELLASNLRRYPAFREAGFTVASVGQRTYSDRALEWSGLKRTSDTTA